MKRTARDGSCSLPLTPCPLSPAIKNGRGDFFHATPGAMSRIGSWLRPTVKSGRNASSRNSMEPVMPTITPFLWFDTQAEEAMNFYASIFGRSKVLSVTRSQGKALSVRFELEGPRMPWRLVGRQHLKDLS